MRTTDTINLTHHQSITMSTKDIGAMFSAAGPSSKKGTKKIPPTAFTSRVSIPLIPSNSSDNLRFGMALYLMLCGTSASRSVEEWKKYIAVYSAFIVPSVGARLATEVYQTYTLGSEKIASIENAYVALRQAMSSAQSALELGPKNAFYTACAIEGLPTPRTNLPWEESYNVMHGKVVASHYSIVLFIMAKRVEADNHAPITQARPEALKNKAHLSGVIAFLDGSLRLSDESHLAINSAWSESAALRATCITEFVTYSGMETETTQDLIYTSMHLMKFGGMNHAKITYAFLRAYPWAGEVPALKSAVGVYVDSVRAAQKYSDTLRPYLKLIYGDKLSIFPRNDLEVLIACAVEIEKVANPTLADFFVNDRFGAVVEAFMDELEKRGLLRVKLLDNALKAAGVDEVEEEEEGEYEAEDDQTVPVNPAGDTEVAGPSQG